MASRSAILGDFTRSEAVAIGMAIEERERDGTQWGFREHSEHVAIGMAIEEREREQARERQIELGRTHGTPSDKKPEGVKGDVRDIVGARVGMAGSTYVEERERERAAARKAATLAKPGNDGRNPTGGDKKTPPADDAGKTGRASRW